MANKSYELIVFDWDGTLCDSMAHICQSMQVAIAELQLPSRSNAQIICYVGLGLADLIYQLYPGLERYQQEQLMARYRYHFFGQKEAIVLFAGSYETLVSLKQQGYKLAIATGKSHSGLQTALAMTGVSHLIDASRTADQTHSKPHPQMLEELMQELWVEPQATLMIGDTSFDLELAANAKVDALAATYGMHSMEQLSGYQPLAFLKDIRDLLPWLKKG